MSSSILGTVLGMGLADQQAAARQAEQDLEHSRWIASINAKRLAHQAESNAILREQMQTKNTHELIQAEVKGAKKLISSAANSIHDSLDDKEERLMKFVGEKEDEQTGLIREVLTVVHEQADEIKALRADLDALKREHV